MKALRLLLLSALLLTSPIASPAQPDTCKIGIFINSVYDINIGEKCFTSNFWIWMLSKDSTLDFNDDIEFRSTKTTELLQSTLEKKKGLYWNTQKWRNVVTKDWDVSNFPFDKQSLTMYLESASRDTSKLIFLPDRKNSTIDPAFYNDEWRITRFEISSYFKNYPTTFGDPTLKKGSSFSAIRIDITIERSHHWLLFFKIFGGVILSFLVGMSCFLIDVRQTSARFSIAVGAIWAAVASKFTIDLRVPDRTSFDLIDSIHNVTFFMILLAITLSAFFLKQQIVVQANLLSTAAKQTSPHGVHSLSSILWSFPCL
ncbi:MAG: hypothetical protein ACOYNC_17910 [Bacteroidales bacterium]